MTTRDEYADGAPGGNGESPLLRALLREAERKGHTLKGLAKALGVTYEHLAQWRRGEASIATAKKSVHARAAVYLGLPLVLVRVLAGQLELQEFVWPTRLGMRERIANELERIRSDPYLGVFTPPALGQATESVQLFVIFLYRNLIDGSGLERQHLPWLTALQSAVFEVHGPGFPRPDESDLF